MGSRGVKIDANGSNGASGTGRKVSKEEVFQGEDGMVEPYSGRVQGDSSEGHMEILVASEEGAGVTLGLPQRGLCRGSWGWGSCCIPHMSALLSQVCRGPPG